MSVPWYAVAVGGIGALAALWLLFKAIQEARSDAAVTAELVKATSEDFGTETAPVEGTKTIEVDSDVLYTFEDGAQLVCVTATRGTRTNIAKMIRLLDGSLKAPHTYARVAIQEGVRLADFTCPGA